MNMNTLKQITLFPSCVIIHSLFARGKSGLTTQFTEMNILCANDEMSQVFNQKNQE
jgi:hypothetical protein